MVVDAAAADGAGAGAGGAVANTGAADLIAAMRESLSNANSQAVGDITIPVYIGNERIEEIVVKANKAYLPILTENVPAGARLNIIFDEGTSTGISSVNTENLNKNNDVYNLNGQRVENMKKGGLYIVNGKKVFMKGQR